MKDGNELFIVERGDGEWVSADDRMDYSVFGSYAEAQEALDGDSDSRDEDVTHYKILRFVREKETQ